MASRIAKNRLPLRRIKRSAMNQSGLSIVIPAFNEERGIELVVSELLACVHETGLNWEVIVVNDGSSDGTENVLSKISEIKVVNHTQNRGYGAALKTGIRYARHELICITDADGTYPTDIIPSLYQRILEGNVDMVVGSRKASDSAFARRPAKWCIRKLAEYICSEKIPDFNSGLRIFKKNKAMYFYELLPDGFSFTTTITVSMLNSGYLVEFLPIEYFPRIGRSKISPFRDTKNFLMLILRLALYFQPLKIFIPLSLILAFLSLFWGAFTLFVLGRLADVTTIMLFLGSIQIGAIGLVADLIDRRIPSVYKKTDD